jgi:zinc protease
MKRFLPVAFCAVMAVGGAGAAAKKAGPALPAHYKDIVPSADAYEPPYPPDYRVSLKGGAVAYLVPDSTLDLVRFTLYSTGRSQPAKPSDVARLQLYSALLKDGGTRALTPSQLEDSLEFIAAGLSAGLGAWQNSGSFDALSKDADAMMGLLADVVLEPRNDPAIFKLTQRQMQEGIKHRYATPGAVMGALYEYVMQGSHPVNWRATEQEVAKAMPGDLAGVTGGRNGGFSREKLVIGVAGRFDRAEMIRKLNAFVDRFPDSSALFYVATHRPAIRREIPPFRGPLAPGVYIVDKPFAQTTLRLALPGVQRPHPDYYRLAVASYILGDGGFTSRLVQKVRSDEGLAYGVGSEVESDYNRRGTVYVSMQTKSATGAYAIRIVREEIRRMARDGVTDTELEKAKDGLLKSLPSLFDTPAATARIFAQSEAWKRSPEHFRDYRKAIEGMTRAEVEDAFRRYFIADSLRIIAVGPKKVLLLPDDLHGDASLSDFGPVREITEAELDKRE